MLKLRFVDVRSRYASFCTRMEKMERASLALFSFILGFESDYFKMYF